MTTTTTGGLRERLAARLPRRGTGQHGTRPGIAPSALVDGLAVVALVLTAMTTLSGTYDGPGYLLAAGLGALAGIGAAALVLWRRAPMVTVALPVVLAAFVVGPPAVLRGTDAHGVPGPTGLREMWDVGIGGWKELLTTLPPLDDTGRLTAVPFLLSLAAAAVGYLVARRWWQPFLPVIGPLGGFAAAAVLGVTDPAGITARALGFGLLSVAWAAERRRRLVVATGGGAMRRMVTGAVLLGAASAVGIGLAPAVTQPASARSVLRDTVVPPIDLADQPSPLADFRRFRPGVGTLADQELLRVTGLPPGTVVRLATVDAYAGTVWAAGQEGVTEEGGVGGGTAASTIASQGRFLRVGARIPESRSGRPVSATMTIGSAYADTPDLRIWVPGVGEPTGIALAGPQAATLTEGLRYNPVTGSAVVLDGLSAGDTVRLDAVLPDESAPTSVGAVGPPTAPNAYTSIVASFVSSTKGVSGTSITALRAVADRLRTTGAYTDGGQGQETFLAGHSLGRLTQFLDEGEPAGNDEQYAAALALVADYLGLPSRVVLGAVPEASGVILGSDVRAYVEVQVAPDRWWTIPPEQFIPPRDKAPQPRNQTEENRAEAAVVPPPNEQHPPSSLEGFALDTTSSSRARSLVADQGWSLPAWAVLALKVASVPIGLVVAWTVLLVGLKALRRLRRSRRGSPGERVAAAWEEVVGVLRDAGVPVAARHTRPELGAAAPHPGVAEVAALTDRLTFGPAPVGDDDAVEAWAQVRRVRGQVAADLRWRDRWRSAVSLRSLLPDRVVTTAPVAPSQVHRSKVSPAIVEPVVDLG